ncbi:hypothetical protein [Piscirickettsia salmonis]|uniref:hypothetical protein n=1 Tax=Piscirickettsia salmonis TaxID=1238 RepID=UPI001E37647C|nr:hypothetical protein [Piscirickettsia salmonis]
MDVQNTYRGSDAYDSPDLNPIEHVWSPLKNRVRMKLDQDEINLETALSQVMKSMSETIR